MWAVSFKKCRLHPEETTNSFKLEKAKIKKRELCRKKERKSCIFTILAHTVILKFGSSLQNH